MAESYFDISVSIRTDLPVWPGHPDVEMEPVLRLDRGDENNVTSLGIATHTGTHVDAEWHFIKDGRKLEALTPDRLIGPCYVADLTSVNSHVTSQDLNNADIPDGTTRLILKTRNSDIWTTSPSTFDTSYCGIAPDGADWLVARGIDVIGIDYHSVEPYGAPGTTHRIILGAGRVILETVDLRSIEPGHYTLYCLPLRVDGFDGAPCRAVLGTNG
jgi:arylformamidase